MQMICRIRPLVLQCSRCCGTISEGVQCSFNAAVLYHVLWIDGLRNVLFGPAFFAYKVKGSRRSDQQRPALTLFIPGRILSSDLRLCRVQRSRGSSLLWGLSGETHRTLTLIVISIAARKLLTKLLGFSYARFQKLSMIFMENSIKPLNFTFAFYLKISFLSGCTPQYFK